MAEIKRSDIAKTIKTIAAHVRPENFVPCVFGLCEVWVNHLHEQDGFANNIKWSVDSHTREIIFSIYDEHAEATKILDVLRY